MNAPHLSDTEIQEFAESLLPLPAEAAAHLEECTACKVKTENYQFMFSALKSSAKPSFDFDTSALVPWHRPPQRTVYHQGAIAAATAGIAVTVAGMLFFIDSLLLYFTSLPVLWLKMLIVPALVLLALQILGYYKAYSQSSRQLNTL